MSHLCKAGLFFLQWITADPSPWGNSTDETLAWRDPGGSWACLQPALHYGWNHPVRVAVTCHLSRVTYILHIPCWFLFYLGSFSYTPRAGFFLLLLFPTFFFLFFFSFLFLSSGEFLLHIPLCFLFFFFFSFLMLRASLVCSLLWRQPLKKGAGWKMAQTKNVKKSRSKQRRNPTTPYTEQNKTKQELSDKWPQKRKGNKRNGS